MTWFKFMKKEHAIRMVSSGSVRIGTLSDYRLIEKHGVSIGDKAEGQKTIYSADQAIKRSAQELNWLERKRFGIASDTATELLFADNVIEERIVTPDCYIFCVSREFLVDALHRMNTELEEADKAPYDACVRIDDPIRFRQVLAAHLAMRHGLQLWIYGDCTYRDRRIRWDENVRLRGVMLKSQEYAYQNEARVVFSANQNAQALEPIIASVSGLVGLSSLHWTT